MAKWLDDLWTGQLLLRVLAYLSSGGRARWSALAFFGALCLLYACEACVLLGS